MGRSRTYTTICRKLFEDGQDGREMVSNYDEIEAQEKLEILGVKMHLLPSGSSYYVNANRTDEKKIASLFNAIKYLVLPGPAQF